MSDFQKYLNGRNILPLWSATNCSYVISSDIFFDIVYWYLTIKLYNTEFIEGGFFLHYFSRRIQWIRYYLRIGSNIIAHVYKITRDAVVEEVKFASGIMVVAITLRRPYICGRSIITCARCILTWPAEGAALVHDSSWVRPMPIMRANSSWCLSVVLWTLR